jgi:hypothetical protein
MKDAALFLLATFFSAASRNVLAQDMQQQSQSATGNWIISETTSPVDYSPVVVAITRSRESSENPAMQLSVYCRNGQTYVVLTGPAISSRRDNYAISYSVNGGEPTRAEAGPASFGAGAAFRGDVSGNSSADGHASARPRYKAYVDADFKTTHVWQDPPPPYFAGEQQ